MKTISGAGVAVALVVGISVGAAVAFTSTKPVNPPPAVLPPVQTTPAPAGTKAPASVVSRGTRDPRKDAELRRLRADLKIAGKKRDLARMSRDQKAINRLEAETNTAAR
jgi:hypothetical protein